jgi:hypothetical protein
MSDYQNAPIIKILHLIQSDMSARGLVLERGCTTENKMVAVPRWTISDHPLNQPLKILNLIQ